VTVRSRVWLSDVVVDFLLSEADAAAPNETGGILLGYSAQDSWDTVVTHAIGPGPKAVHALDRFAPDYDYQDAEVARIYEESNRQVSYLGDWHCHPKGCGRLSRTDKRTFRQIAECAAARVPEPVMLILTDGPDWAPVAWRGKIVRRFLWFPRFVTVPVDVETFRAD